MEAEILFPVKCSLCARETLTSFRMSVVMDALSTGQIRLYSECHVAGWDASDLELAQIREYLDATWCEALHEAVQLAAMPAAWDEEDLVFVHTGVLDERGTYSCQAPKAEVASRGMVRGITPAESAHATAQGNTLTPYSPG